MRERGATVVTASHLGRPKGKPDPKYSMDAVRARLAELAPGVELLENLRYDPGEEGNDDGVRQAARRRDRRLRQRRVRRVAPRPRQHRRAAGSSCRARLGRLLQREVDVLLGMRNKPARPFVAVLGGAKVSDKLGVIDALLETVDALAIGGAMCFTFLAAQGNPIGDSLFEPDQVDTCQRLLDATAKPIHLPSDIVGLDADGNVQTYGTRLPDGAKGLDIGPGSAAEFGDVVMDARTVFWNGPMGMFEDERFAVRHPCRRPGDGRHEGVHGRRRRRLGGRPRRVRPRRRGRPRVDRRRGVARAARARRPAGPAQALRRGGPCTRADRV